MRCSKCRLLYTQWKDGELSARREAEIERHLAGCGACRSLYGQLDSIVETSSSLPRFRASEDLALRVLARIRSSETVAPVRLSRWLAPRLAYGAAAMAVAAVLSFAFFDQYGRKRVALVADSEAKERVYSLGPAVRSTELAFDEPDYSLGHTQSREGVVYSLPSLPATTRPASY
jgi:anti-sigma factor RsiW